jgi:hypothetical protein
LPSAKEVWLRNGVGPIKWEFLSCVRNPKRTQYWHTDVKKKIRKVFKIEDVYKGYLVSCKKLKRTQILTFQTFSSIIYKKCILLCSPNPTYIQITGSNNIYASKCKTFWSTYFISFVSKGCVQTKIEQQ